MLALFRGMGILASGNFCCDCFLISGFSSDSGHSPLITVHALEHLCLRAQVVCLCQVQQPGFACGRS